MTVQDERRSGAGTAGLAAERDRLVAELSAVVRTLDEYRDDLEDVAGVAEIRRLAPDVQTTTDELLKDRRLLRLGIVGQIKAGKSTLLNLLLFDGREVLPRAATPMTASLTHIVRSDEVGSDRAEIDVNYYSPEEWREIETHAAECLKQKEAGRTPGKFLHGCAEQVAMAEKLGIRVTGPTGTTIESVSIASLNQRLCSLVGADGKLTPRVKSVKIRCGSGLPDLDIVDTPGLNDPIVSRNKETRRLLARCDAVLLLSYAGQFMDSADVELFRHKLPAEGIAKCVLVGSKFDSALIDEARTYHGDLHGAVEGVEGQLRKRARAEIDRMRDKDGFVSIDEELLDAIGDIDRDGVLFMSAMCAILGAKPNQYSKWNAAERDVFQSLRRSFPDWFDLPENGAINDDTASNLTYLLGRREKIEDRIENIRDHKDEIVGNKARNYLQQKEARSGTLIESITVALNQKREDLRTAKLDNFDERKSAVLESISRVEDGIESAWISMVYELTKGLKNARKDCREKVSALRGAIGSLTYRKQYRRRKPSGFCGIKTLMRFLSGESQYSTYEREVLDEQKVEIEVDNARDQLRSIIRDEFRDLFSNQFVDQAKKVLSAICADNIDSTTASKTASGVELSSIVRSLHRAVEKVAQSARQKVEMKLPFVIRERSMALKGSTKKKVSLARTFVNAIGDEVKKAFDEADGILDDVCKEASGKLVPVAIVNLETYHERLKQDIEEKEFRMQRYERAIHDLKQHGRRFEGTACSVISRDDGQDS